MAAGAQARNNPKLTFAQRSMEILLQSQEPEDMYPLPLI
jgi:hypothetical protein